MVGARGRHRRTVREVIERLRRIYCGPIGVEFMHIGDAAARDWVAAEMEGDHDQSPDAANRLRMLRRLTDAEAFETFLRRKYLGATSFSLEGSESLVALLDRAIEKAGGQGTAEIVIGMAHRGRLNVLANILGKPPREIFREFEDREPRRYRGSGDVSYHLGHSTDWVTAAGERVHLSLCFNPSHLEFIDPVAVGRVRAKQDRVGDLRRERGLALLIHGDASFAGEGVVQETLVLSELPAYRVGGTLHVVVNNQIGFTTSPDETPLERVRDQRRQDDRLADLPRQRRRPRCRVSRGRAGDGLPAPLRARRVHRPLRLPAAGPQRGRRAVVHPAAALSRHPRARAGARRSTPAA